MDSQYRTDGSGLHCPHCGSETAVGHSYCIQCGGDLSDLHEVADSVDSPTESRHSTDQRSKDGQKRGRTSSDANTATSEDIAAFRRRVSTLVADGWDIEYDRNDEVVLVDRGVGSIPVHILLLIFTSGVGNVIYGWYKYSHAADRMVLRADGTQYDPTAAKTAAVDGYEEPSGSVGQFAGGLLLFVLGSIITIGSGLDLGVALFGLLFVVISLFVMPPTRRRIDNRQPPTTFGPTESVDERFVTGTNKPCTVCGSRVEDGVVRDYTQEKIFAGIPLYTMEDGENYYCSDCRTSMVSHRRRSFDEHDAVEAELEQLTAESGKSSAPTDSDDQSDGINSELR